MNLDIDRLYDLPLRERMDNYYHDLESEKPKARKDSKSNLHHHSTRQRYFIRKKKQGHTHQFRF